jgi:hypothetical protein
VHPADNRPPRHWSRQGDRETGRRRRECDLHPLVDSRLELVRVYV